MAFDFGIFLGQALSTMYPNAFFLAFMCVLCVGAILIMIRSPAAFTIMACFVTFALVAGGGIFGAAALMIPQLFPVLVLIVLLIGGAIAYAFWRMLGY